MTPRTLLLTGATGFVGRNILLDALHRGIRVLAPVRDAEKLRSQLAIEGVDSRTVTPLPAHPAEWQDIEADAAVLSAGVLFARSREEYFNTNVAWTLSVIRALPPACRIVVLSSQSAGGPTPSGIPARVESTPDAPLTWYGESKLALEQALPSDRRITILRPPMILGARDTATLPLFKMARGLIRPKPGLRQKEYSYIAVDDLVCAIRAAFSMDVRGPFYVAAGQRITDAQLISTAARIVGGRGRTVPIPEPAVRLLARLVDAVPKLRASTPSLTRDRAREIWPDRWVVDSGQFRRATGWSDTVPFERAMTEAFASYRSRGDL